MFGFLTPWFKGDTPEAVLWRSTLLFVSLDVFFTGLVGAYAFSFAGVPGVLAFIAAQQICTTGGHLASNVMMRRIGGGPHTVQRWGVAGLALCLLISGGAPVSKEVILAILSCGGGLARGITYGSRLWMEAQLPGALVRHKYFAMVEATATMFKVVAPATALLILTMTPRFETVYLLAGVLFFIILAFTKAGVWDVTLPDPLELGNLLRQSAYWTNAPFFLVEGASHAVRTALFVSGAMTVVGSIKGFAAVEVGASLCAVAWLLVQSRVALPGASMRLLGRYQLILGLAWVSLLLALWKPAMLPVFIVLYALAIPLITAQKNGVTLAGMIRAPVKLEDNLVGRSLLTVVARVVTLAGIGLVYLAGASPFQLLVAMTGVALVLLPIEYITAGHLHNRFPATSPTQA